MESPPSNTYSKTHDAKHSTHSIDTRLETTKGGLGLKHCKRLPYEKMDRGVSLQDMLSHRSGMTFLEFKERVVFLKW